MPTPLAQAPIAAALLFLGAAATAAEPAPAAPQAAPQANPEVNQGQQLVFMNDLLRQVPAGTVLEYTFTRRGKDLPDYRDRVKVTVTRVADDGTRDLEFDFLTAGYHLDFHSATAYRGNPVPIQFLERDIKEMSEATEGDIGYFRNRIRKAFGHPDIRPVKIDLAGKQLDGTQVAVTPYVEDPSLAKLKTYGNKRYEFQFSEQVPGGLYLIRTTVPSASGDGVVIEEQLTFAQATPAG